MTPTVLQKQTEKHDDSNSLKGIIDQYRSFILAHSVRVEQSIPQYLLLQKEPYDIENLVTPTWPFEDSVNSNKFATKNEESIVNPLLSLLEMNNYTNDKIFNIIHLHIKQSLSEYKKDIASAALVDSSYVKYAIRMKDDNLKKVNKIYQILFDLKNLNLPFEVKFQFADQDLFSKYKILDKII